MTRRWWLLLFFGSGCAALVYEVVWIRLLTLTLSITVYSLTTVLCAFMAGLGLGAAISAVVGDRLRRPLRAFAWIELGIGLSGLAIPTVLFNLGPVYVGLHGVLGGAGAVFEATRFLLAFAVLLVPATLMGVTLPLLTRALIHRPEVAASRAGSLYAANTLGAVVGCVVAGFALIPAVGLTATSVAAAALNLVVGLTALALERRQSRPAAPAPAADVAPLRQPLSPLGRLAALAFAISGFTAMGYEVLWTRALEPFTHNSTYAYSAMLAMFLFGLGAGSAALAGPADRVRRPLLALGTLQVAIGVSVAAALLLYAHFQSFTTAAAIWFGAADSWGRTVALIFTEAGLTLAATTFLLGAVFPFVARIAVDSLEGVARRVGTVYVANTLGSILGSVGVGFVLLPKLGVRGAFVVLIAANLALGAFLALRAARSAGALVVAGTAAVTAALVFTLVPGSLFEQQFAGRFGEILFYREEVTDTVMVTENDRGARMIRYADGRGTAGTWTVHEDRIYAHLPLLLHPDPKHVLQIAFGVGNSLSAALQHPIERVDCIELSPGVIDAAPFFESTNRNALDDPRVELVINDGRNFLLTSRDRYDVIRLDPPELHTAGVVNLYTREFYELARDHLNENGIFSIWINATMTPVEDLRMLVRTATEVFPHVSVWHGPEWYSWIINGSMTSHAPDLERLERRFRDERVAADLESIGVPDPFYLLALFIFSDEALESWVGDGPIVTDDHTRVDFSVPRSRESFFGLSNANTNYWIARLMEPGERRRLYADLHRKNLALAAHKTSVLPHVVNVESAGYERAAVGERIDAAREAFGR